MNKVTNVLLHSFITNIALSIIKVVSGVIGASGALIADGVHSLSDTITDVFAILGSRWSRKPADEKHPFGHGKIEYITCIVIGLVVAVMGITIIYNALTEERVIPSIYVAIIGIIVIGAKLILARYILNKGKEYNSNILMASGNESFSDVISSIVVLLSILIAQLGKVYSIFAYADSVAMILVGILILRIAYNILKENFSGLLGEQVIDDDYMTALKKIISAHEEVKSIDELIVLKYGPVYHVTSEVSMDKDIILKEAHDILDNIETQLKDYDKRIDHIIIHINPYKSWLCLKVMLIWWHKSMRRTSNIGNIKRELVAGGN